MNEILLPEKPATTRNALHERGFRLAHALPLIGICLLIVNHVGVVTGHTWLIPHFLQLP